MKTIMASPFPYLRSSLCRITVNGFSIAEAGANVHEPGWDICFHIVAEYRGTKYTFMIINDALYTYNWFENRQGLAIYNIIKHEVNYSQDILDSFKELMAGETT